MGYQLKKTKQRNGRIFLEIVDSRYVKSKGYAVPIVVKKIGYLDDMEKIYVDPISYFKEQIKEMESNRKKEENDYIPRESSEINLGSFLPLHLLKKLRLNDVSNALDKGKKREFNHYDVLEFLTLTRIIYPSSKIDTYLNKLNHFYKKYEFSKDQMYKGLEIIGENDEAYLEYLNYRIDKLYGRDLSSVYFDATNFYFEIDPSSYDEYRRPGPSKENKEGALISLGLLLDKDAIPLFYKLFPGNKSEKPILNEIIKTMKETCEVKGRTIRIADKGLNSTENIIDAYTSGDGYIYSKAIRSSDDKRMILDENGYEEIKNEEEEVTFKSKSWIDTYEYKLGERSYKLKEKRIVIWSKKYALKRRYERNKAIEKEEELSSIASIKKSSLSKAIDTLYDVMNVEEGTILSSKDIELILNKEKLASKEELDGYYMIVTSETNLEAKEIIASYRKLWEIEASFRITKLQLEARPIYVSKLNSIKGHFLTCYLALLLTRLIQKKEFKGEFNAETIIDFIKTLKASPLALEQYLLSGGKQEFIKAVEKRYRLNFNHRTLSKAKLEKLFSF